MELSNDVTSGLSSLADIKQFNAGQFNLMVEGTVDVLLNNGSASKTFSGDCFDLICQRFAHVWFFFSLSPKSCKGGSASSQACSL